MMGPRGFTSHRNAKFGGGLGNAGVSKKERVLGAGI